MKIFAISLKTAQDRRAVMVEQMTRLGLPFEFVDGIDGKQLSDEDISGLCDQKWAYRYEGRHFTRSEIGCYASHIKVYRKIVEEKIPYALILEDDAWLTPSIVWVLEAMDAILSAAKNDVYLLQEKGPGGFKKNGKRISIIGDLYVFKEICASLWAHAYVVTFSSAQSLLNALTPVQHVSDCWGWIVRHRVATVYCMNRTLSTQNMYALPSNIGFGRFEKNKWFMGGITHKMYRAFWLGYDILAALKRRSGLPK